MERISALQPELAKRLQARVFAVAAVPLGGARRRLPAGGPEACSARPGSFPASRPVGYTSLGRQADGGVSRARPPTLLGGWRLFSLRRKPLGGPGGVIGDVPASPVLPGARPQVLFVTYLVAYSSTTRSAAALALALRPPA